MTGPEHYGKAQRALAGAYGPSIGEPTEEIAIAQVHATLALTAAVVDAANLTASCITGNRLTRLDDEWAITGEHDHYSEGESADD